MSWSIRREYLVVFGLAVIAEVGVRTVRLERLARLFSVSLAPTGEPGGSPATVPEWARARLRVIPTVMNRWPVDGTCLRQSLVTGQRLRKLRPTLHIGVRRGEDAVLAHAWVDIDGRSLDASSIDYLELELDR